MPSTLTMPKSETVSARAVPPGRARWRYRRTLALVLLLGGLLCSGFISTYLQFGWFESERLGQVLQIRRMHAEGPRYSAQSPWGVSPRAHRLLHDTFTDNTWTIVSTDDVVLYQHLPNWWTVPLSQIPQQVRAVFVFREDQRFYHHAGVDGRALLRAIVKTLTGRKQGGSTIAIQVAKHCLLNYGARPTRAGLSSGIRKVREMLLAWRLVKVEGLVDGRPVVLLGGELDLFHYVFQARRQVGSVSKLFFYETVWRLGYVHPDAMVEDGDIPELLRQRLARPPYQPRNDDGRLRAPLAHYQSLSQSVNKIAYRTTWGERTDAQRHAIARILIERFGFPWHHVTQHNLAHFYKVFTADETVPLGTWQATPFEVAAMLEKGFRGSSLTPDHLILSWNGKPIAPAIVAPTPGLSRALLQALRGAVAVTAPQAVLHNAAWTLAAKTGTTDGGRDAWFAGFLLPAQQIHQTAIRPRITFVVWAGYDDNRPAGLYGGHVHGPIFRRFLWETRVQVALRTLLQEKP